MAAGVLILSGCGYQLVGHGEGGGAIPADVRTVSISGNVEASTISALKRKLASESYSFSPVGDDPAHHATLYIRIAPLVFTPSAYDRAGVATQYRMVYSGSLSLQRQGDVIWQSGAITQQGDVFATGGPTGIGASRDRLLKELRQQWLIDAVGRIRSGF